MSILWVGEYKNMLKPPFACNCDTILCHYVHKNACVHPKTSKNDALFHPMLDSYDQKKGPRFGKTGLKIQIVISCYLQNLNRVVHIVIIVNQWPISRKRFSPGDRHASWCWTEEFHSVTRLGPRTSSITRYLFVPCTRQGLDLWSTKNVQAPTPLKKKKKKKQGRRVIGLNKFKPSEILSSKLVVTKIDPKKDWLHI